MIANKSPNKAPAIRAARMSRLGLLEEPMGAAYVDGTNLYQAFAENPINRVDPNGEKWKFVPNMGRLSGNLGPGPSLKWARFDLTFTPDSAAFKKIATCDEINFLQIKRYHTTEPFFQKGFNSLVGVPENVWTVDDTGSDDKPYYNNAKDAMDPRTGVLKTNDTPGLDLTLGTTQVFDFETVVVATKGPDKGNVYATIDWGFNFYSAGPVWNSRIVPKYYVNNVVWSPESPVTSVQMTDASGNLLFKKVGTGAPKPAMQELGGNSGNNVYNFSFSQAGNKGPSPDMSKILDQYFP